MVVAKLWKTVDGKDYLYGVYNFNTPEERNRVNQLAEQLRVNDVQTWVERIEEE